MNEYTPSRTSEMDKVLMVKDLYCLVDHLEENLRFVETTEEKEILLDRIRQATELRRYTTMTLNGDKNFACAFKHASGAWRAAEEVYLTTYSDEALKAFEEATELFYWVAEQFLGHPLERCKRCGKEVNDSEEEEL